MGLLDGKIALVVGVANYNSIGWGIAKQFHAQGATVLLSYAGPALEKRVRPLAEEIGCEFVVPCDASNDDEMDALFEAVRARYGRLDVLVHSVAFAPREDLGGRFVDVSRAGMLTAIDISAYSLLAMTRRAEPLMPDGGSIMSLTYYASEKVFPRYNAMAIAKAALEAITRYLAADMGPQRIRVNAISAGPIKTLAAAGVPGFRSMLKASEAYTPLRTNVSQEDVGQAAVFLASDMSRMITGEVLYVDAGYHVLGLFADEETISNPAATE